VIGQATQEKWLFCNVYLCIGAKKSPFCKTNTPMMVAKVNNLHTEEKQSFVYLRIHVRAKKSQPKSTIFSTERGRNQGVSCISQFFLILNESLIGSVCYH
jgi:hypothetical protein